MLILYCSVIYTNCLTMLYIKFIAIFFIVSVLSKIDRKIILEKYKKTCLIEANGGQMIKVKQSLHK